MQLIVMLTTCMFYQYKSALEMNAQQYQINFISTANSMELILQLILLSFIFSTSNLPTSANIILVKTFENYINYDFEC